MKLQRHQFKAEIKALENKSADEFIVEAYVSIFDNVDLVNDVIIKGAFSESLAQKMPKGVWMHNWDEPIAKTLEAREDEKGLYIKAKFINTVQKAREAFDLIKEGVIDEFSIGYEVLKDEMDQETGIRKLLKLRLFEWSPVLYGANPKTEVVGVKSVVPFASYDKADEDTDWDAEAVLLRIKKWASSDGSGDKETIDWEKYRKAFAWYDSENAEGFGAYKLPHHDVVDGKLVTVWRGVATAMTALMGARGGVSIPDDEFDGVYSHIAKHYDEFEKTPPEKSLVTEIRQEFKTVKDELQKSVDLVADLQAKRVLTGETKDKVDDALSNLESLNDTIKNLSTSLKELKSACSIERGEKVEPISGHDKKVMIRIRQAVKQIDRASEFVLRVTK